MKTTGCLSLKTKLLFLLLHVLLIPSIVAQSVADPDGLLEQYLATGSYDIALQIRNELPGTSYARFVDAWDLVEVDHVKALKMVDSLLSDEEHFAPAYFLLGVVRLKGFLSYRDAIAAFDQCLAIDPSFTRAMEYRGIANLELQAYEDALMDFEQVLNLQRGYARAFILRAVAHHGMGERDAMIADFEIGLQLDFQALAPIYTSLAKEAMDQAIASAPDNAIYRFARGYAYFSKGDYKRAGEDFQRCINLVPGSSDFYKYSGASKMYQKDTEGGQKDLNYALSVNPDDPQTYYFLGVLMNDYLDRSGRALEYMNQAISLDDQNARYYYERAKASADLMSLESARDDINRALMLNQREGDFYALRGQIKQELGRPAEEFCPDYVKAQEQGTSYKLKRIVKRNCR